MLKSHTFINFDEKSILIDVFGKIKQKTHRKCAIRSYKVFKVIGKHVTPFR